MRGWNRAHRRLTMVRAGFVTLAVGFVTASFVLMHVWRFYFPLKLQWELFGPAERNHNSTVRRVISTKAGWAVLKEENPGTDKRPLEFGWILELRRPDGEMVWSRSEFGRYRYGWDLSTDSDGHIYVLGSEAAGQGKARWFVQQCGETGSSGWRAHGGRDDYGVALVSDGRGGLLIAGDLAHRVDHSGGEFAMAVWRLAGNGKQDWSAVASGPVEGRSGATVVAVDRDGGGAVAGVRYSMRGDNPTGWSLTRFRKDGLVMWTRTVDWSPQEFAGPDALLSGESGEWIVAGTATPRGEHDSRWTAVCWGNAGELKWECVFPSRRNYDCFLFGGTRGGSNSYWLVGHCLPDEAHRRLWGTEENWLVGRIIVRAGVPSATWIRSGVERHGYAKSVASDSHGSVLIGGCAMPYAKGLWEAAPVLRLYRER